MAEPEPSKINRRRSLRILNNRPNNDNNIQNKVHEDHLENKPSSFSSIQLAAITESVLRRSAELKSILRAAQRLSRSAQKIARRNQKKKIRFDSHPRYIDITPRSDKIAGVVKMPDDSPIESSDEKRKPRNTKVRRRVVGDPSNEGDLEKIGIDPDTKSRSTGDPVDLILLSDDSLASVLTFDLDENTATNLVSFKPNKKNTRRRRSSGFFQSLNKKCNIFDDEDDNSPVFTEPGLEPKVASEIDRRTLPWVDLLRPKSSADIVGNRDSVDALKRWLSKWRTKLMQKTPSNNSSPTKAKRRKKSAKSDDDNEYEGEIELENNIALIQGPTGSGKTSLVYCLAEELGFSVIEINASVSRTYRDIVSNHLGATHTRRIDLQQQKSNFFIPMTKKPTSPAKKKKNNRKPGDIRSFFVKTNIKLKNNSDKIGQKIFPNDIITIDDVKMVENSVKNRKFEKAPAMSIILIDDVDIVFKQDENFWNGVRDLTTQCRIPIILTTADSNLIGLNSLPCDVEKFYLTKYDEKNFGAKFLENFADKFNNIPAVVPASGGTDTESFLVKFADQFTDYRQTLNNMQFYLSSTLPQLLLLNEKNCLFPDQCDNNDDPRRIFLRFRNSSRLLYGLTDDKTVPSDDDPFADKVLLLAETCSNPQDIGNTQISTVKSHLPPKLSHCESVLAMDCMPYLRQMARFTEKSIVEKRRNGRLRAAYLHRIGLDDKWSTVQNVLNRNVFNIH